MEPGADRDMLLQTLERLKQLHHEGRNHIWAYYTRNLVRPVWLSTDTGRVDRIVGNPPWLTYNKTASTIRSALQNQAKTLYGLWPERQFVTQADLAGLFYTRCVDLYLKPGGQAAMVMPHSALAAGQYAKWRTGEWGPVTADLSRRNPWDLEKLDPNDFFPVPASVVFTAKADSAVGLPPLVQQWHGSPEDPAALNHKLVSLGTTGAGSPYGPRARNGATVYPRALFFVDAQPSAIALVSGVSVTSPLRSSQENPPWKDLPLSQLAQRSIPDDYIHDVHKGDTLAPFVTMDPGKAVLPFTRLSQTVPKPDPTTGDVPLHQLDSRVRGRWKDTADAWNANKPATNRLSLIKQLDTMNKLSNQVPTAAIRLLYSKSGRPTASVLEQSRALIDNTLYWIACVSAEEAHFLAAIINSDTRCATPSSPSCPRAVRPPRPPQAPMEAEYPPVRPIRAAPPAAGGPRRTGRGGGNHHADGAALPSGCRKPDHFLRHGSQTDPLRAGGLKDRRQHRETRRQAEPLIAPDRSQRFWLSSQGSRSVSRPCGHTTRPRCVRRHSARHVG